MVARRQRTGQVAQIDWASYDLSVDLNESALENSILVWISKPKRTDNQMREHKSQIKNKSHNSVCFFFYGLFLFFVKSNTVKVNK